MKKQSKSRRARASVAVTLEANGSAFRIRIRVGRSSALVVTEMDSTIPLDYDDTRKVHVAANRIAGMLGCKVEDNSF